MQKYITLMDTGTLKCNSSNSHLSLSTTIFCMGLRVKIQLMKFSLVEVNISFVKITAKT